MSRPRHPSQHIEEAVQYAERNGWMIVMSHGHAWGRMFYSHKERGGCIENIYSTPRNAQNHARRLMRAVDRCPH